MVTRRIEEVLRKLRSLIGKDIREIRSKHASLGKMSNKGGYGHAIELEIGVGLSSARKPDIYGEWELKVSALKILKDGTLTPKETVAVTMIKPEELITTTFYESTCYHKLNKCIYVFWRYVDGIITSIHPIELSEEQLDFLRKDYELIQSIYKDPSKTISGHYGRHLQSRTKGPGGNAPKTRAFYLRPKFFTELLRVNFNP